MSNNIEMNPPNKIYNWWMEKYFREKYYLLQNMHAKYKEKI